MARILYLDNSNDFSGTRRALAAVGHNVDVAPSLSDGCNLLLRTSGYDAIVCDPGAFALDERLQPFLAQRRHDGPVVLHTMLADVERSVGLKRGVHYDRVVGKQGAQPALDVVRALDELCGAYGNGFRR
jgi:hypothetical protein